MSELSDESSRMAKDPRVKAIEEEAHRRSLADDGKTSHKERFAIRKELRADAGLGKEKKKRGGVAGAYDRNKQWAVPLTLAALGMIPGVGPGISALAGAGIDGLDREGQGGIGFDVGGAVQGAAKGYAAGALGNTAGRFLGVGSAPVPVGAASATASGATASNVASSAPWASGAAPTALPAAGGMAPISVPDMLRRGVDWAKTNPRDALGLAQGGFNAYNSAQAMGQQRRATRGMEREWAAGAPLRASGRETLLRGVEGNPFAPVRVR